jgi:hypothetical protein
LNKHLLESIRKHDQHDLDFKSLLTWHLEHGIVVCNHDSFALGYYSANDDPRTALLFGQSNTLFVTMCAGDMRKALEPFANDFEFIAFQRSFKNSHHVRVYEMDKFITKLYK